MAAAATPAKIKPMNVRVMTKRTASVMDWCFFRRISSGLSRGRCSKIVARRIRLAFDGDRHPVDGQRVGHGMNPPVPAQTLRQVRASRRELSASVSGSPTPGPALSLSSSAACSSGFSPGPASLTRSSASPGKSSDASTSSTTSEPFLLTPAAFRKSERLNSTNCLMCPVRGSVQRVFKADVNLLQLKDRFHFSQQALQRLVEALGLVVHLVQHVACLVQRGSQPLRLPRVLLHRTLQLFLLKPQCFRWAIVASF